MLTNFVTNIVQQHIFVKLLFGLKFSILDSYHPDIVTKLLSPRYLLVTLLQVDLDEVHGESFSNNQL